MGTEEEIVGLAFGEDPETPLLPFAPNVYTVI
jgi:hypothetical protein